MAAFVLVLTLRDLDNLTTSGIFTIAMPHDAEILALRTGQAL